MYATDSTRSVNIFVNSEMRSFEVLDVMVWLISQNGDRSPSDCCTNWVEIENFSQFSVVVHVPGYILFKNR